MWISNWKNYLLAGLGACLLLTFGLLHLANSRLAEKTAEIESMKREAQSYKERSATIAKETGDALTVLVEQIKDKDLAFNNYKRRYGNAACGIRADGVFVSPGAGEADSPAGTDAASEKLVVDRTFIDACGIDAGTVGAWQAWARSNDLVQ